MSAGTDQRMKGQGNQGMFGPSFGQQSSYNYFPNNGENYSKNAWDSQQVNGGPRRGYDDYNRGYDKRSYGNDGIKSIEHGMQGMGLDGGNQRDSYASKTNTSSSASKESTDKPKKMTWATIASQPVKSSQTRQLSTLKKKPGMPPPPMIPGKHNMDIGSWDTDKNGAPLVPPPVPSPPPVVDDGPSPFQFQPTKNNNTSANAQQSNAQPQNNRNDDRYREDRYRDDRPITRDRERGPPDDMRGNNGGYRPNQNRYQPHHRSNYDRSNQDRPSYHDNPRYQPRQQFRSSPPSYSNGPQRQYGSENADNDHPRSIHENDNAPTQPEPEPVPEKLLDKTNYNPPELDTEKLDNAKFFIIKSYSEDDIHRSIKYEIWCSTEHGNKRLDQAFRDTEAEGGIIYLLFSVNGSGHFCGVAQMTSAVDYNSVSSVWHQDKWKGKFSLKWVYVKDVPNTQLRHIRLENNENKPVTNSRDTQEVPNAKGQQVLQIIHLYKHTTSIFDDIEFYEQRQVEEDTKRVDVPSGSENGDRHGPPAPAPPQPNYRENRGFHRNDGNYRENNYENRGPRPNYGNNYQGNNNRGYNHNSYDNRRGGEDYHPRTNYDRPPNRDYNNRREGGGFMSRDRGEYRERTDRNDEHHQGGFKRNNSNNFGNRGSNGGYRN